MIKKGGERGVVHEDFTGNGFGTGTHIVLRLPTL